MATISLCSSYSYASIFFKKEYSVSSSSCTFAYLHLISKTRLISSLKSQANYSMRERAYLDHKLKKQSSEKIQEIHCMEEYYEVLQFSNEKLVISHFSSIHSMYNTKILKFMEKKCKESNDQVKFLLVMSNESEKAIQLCMKEQIGKYPYFVFHKNGEKVHEVAGFRPEKLEANILYYGNNHFSHIVQLHYVEHLEKLIRVEKLIVLFVGMRNCNPCVKIYPSVLKLSSQMVGKVVFGRIFCDESDCFMQILRDFDVVKVPTFLFITNGALQGRYVGSTPSRLFVKILKFLENQNQTRM